MRRLFNFANAFLFTCFYPVVIYASNGDRSNFFSECLENCNHVNCDGTSQKVKYGHNVQSLWMNLLKWDCPEECKYDCMWPTVDYFLQSGHPVPKFYGKWPFVRVLGVQEIASSIASLMNLISHVFMIRMFRRKVNKYNPMFWEWHFYAAFSINAWFWSFLFHTRDTPFTEKMDYFCALSVVMFNLFILIYRVSFGNKHVHVSVGVAMATYFVYHVYYLTFVHFDYGYNMTVNMFVGVTGAVGWIIWFLKVRNEQPYVIKSVICILSALLLVFFEVFDFSPFLWTFDAHSLWHFGTSPLAFLWYRFAIDDVRYMKMKSKRF